jgi:DNA-binding CsgD family transcriptional regulator
MRNARRLTAEERETIADMREAGKTYREIAGVLGCSEGAIEWTCLKNGIEKPGGAGRTGSSGKTYERRGRMVRAFSADEDARLLSLEANGYTPKEIGDELGRRPNSVIARLRTLARRDEREQERAA